MRIDQGSTASYGWTTGDSTVVRRTHSVHPSRTRQLELGTMYVPARVVAGRTDVPSSRCTSVTIAASPKLSRSRCATLSQAVELRVCTGRQSHVNV
eukprot:m.71912 g.71912  ORF g.71912 m.71912 type:complete len:96 (-) comp8750_c0_seq1:126-413(-)